MDNGDLNFKHLKTQSVAHLGDVLSIGKTYRRKKIHSLTYDSVDIKTDGDIVRVLFSSKSGDNIELAQIVSVHLMEDQAAENCLSVSMIAQGQQHKTVEGEEESADEQQSGESTIQREWSEYNLEYYIDYIIEPKKEYLSASSNSAMDFWTEISKIGSPKESEIGQYKCNS